MGCEYIYNGQKYTFDEMAALLENGLADDLLRKNVITDAGAFATLEDKTPQTIQMTPSDTSVDLKYTRRFVRTIANQAKSVVKALRKLAPNLNLTIHTTEEAWNALYDKLLTEGYTPEDLANFKNTDGFYTEDGVIHLNAPLMEKRNRQSVLYHEASHAVTNALFNSRPELRNQMAGQITQLANDPSVDPKYKDAIQRTINFGQNYLKYKKPDGTPMYDEDFAKNETIVEFISKICTGEIQITPKEKSAWETLVSILNKLGIMVGFNVRLNNQDVTVNNVLEFANTLNKAFKSGSEISFEEAATELASEDKIETPTTSADFVGQEVIYNGERGTITQDEGGKITFETDTKVYDFDGSEEVKPVNKYKYNEESNTISIGDKNYRVLNVNRQASYPEGEVVFKSVNVADANNKKKTLRDPELAKQVYESQQQRGIIPSMSEDVEIDSEALAKEIASPIVEDNNIITPVRASIKTSNLGSESDAITESKFKKALIPSFSNEEAKKVYESENAVSTPIGNSGIRKITAFDNNLFNNLLERGKILFNVPSLSMNNQIGVVSHPDSMMVGQLRGMLLDKKGKPILNEDGLPDFVIATGSGGVYFATGDIWAFKKQSGGESFVRKINNLLKIAKRTNPDNPVVYFFLGKGGPGKMLSNKESPSGVVKIYENLHRSKLISDNVLRQSIEAALKLSEVKMDADYKKREAKVEKMKEDSDKQKENKEIAKQKLEAYKKEIEKRKAKNLKQIEKLIKSKGVSIEDILEDVFSENGSFEDRGSAIKDFLAKSFTFAKKEKTEGKLIEYFGIKNVTTQDAFMDEVSKMLFEEPILLDVPKQHIYAAIKIDSPIEEYGGEHTTYESHVRFQEPGKVPTLIFFDKPFLSEGSFEDLESGEVLTKEYLGYTNVPMSQDVKARITPSMSEDIRTGDLTSASSAYENMNEDGMGNYVFYPSVVTNGNADVNADGIVELSVNDNPTPLKYTELKPGGKYFGNEIIGFETTLNGENVVVFNNKDSKNWWVTINNDDYQTYSFKSLEEAKEFLDFLNNNKVKKIIYHGGKSKIKKLVSDFIQGGIRGNYGYGVYFTDSPYKAKDYGSEITYLDKSDLNIINLRDKIDEELVNKIKALAEKTKNTDKKLSEYYELAYKVFKENIGKYDINDGKNILEGEAKRNTEKEWSKLLTDLGYDTAKYGYEYVIFNLEKANEFLTEEGDSIQEQFLKYKKEKRSSKNKYIVRIPFEGVYPMDTNPLGLKPKIQPSIIGETGAAELDSSYKNVNNLAIAKKMKAQKKSKQFIKTATGWELGPDGFWRMEISDSKFSYTDDHLNKIIDKAIDGDFTYKPLSSVITNKQLFQAYPELKNINVVFGKTGKVRFSPTAVYNMSPTTGAVYLSGGYGDTHIIINSETLREKGTDELLSYMEHEIQHYIQDKEGFTQGSDTKDEFNTLISKIEDEIFAKSGKPLERKLSNELNRLSTERNALAYNPSEENKQKSIDLYNQKLSIYDNYAKDVLKIGSVYDKAYQNYKNKFGEIEARNVQLRRLIPFELRADMLFEATQDVKNKDAIFTRNDKKIISKLETYRNKSILQQAKNLGFVAVVDKDTEGNAIVMSDTVIPAEPIGTQEFTQNKQVIIPSMFGTPVVEVIEPGEMGAKDVKNVSYNAGPIRELSKFQTTSLGKVFMEYFTPTGGATVMQKELMEQLAGEQSFVANKIKENALALRKLIDNFVNNEGKKVGLTKQTVQIIVNKAMDGEIDPKTGKPFLDQLPSNLADGVVNARQTITNLQEILANSGLLPADMALTIAMSQGTYMKDSFAAFEVKPYNWLMGKITGKKNKYFKGVSEQTRDKVKSYFVSQALLGKLDSGFNVSLADYKKNYEDPYFALLAQDPTAQMAATRQAGLAKDQAFKELEEKARRFAQSKIDEIEDYNPNGDIMFTLSGAPIKMTDYIEKNPNLAPEMKEYLGYIVDPATSFKLTAMKLNRMLYSHQTMQQMKNNGLISGDVVPSTEATPKGWIKLGKISQRDSKTMMGTASDEVDAVNKYGPLKGCSVSPEFYQLVFNTPVTGNWYYQNIASPVKRNLAVINIKNIIRNVWGYSYFGAANGAIPEAIMYAGPLMKANKNKIKTAKEFKDWFVNSFQEAQKRGINTSIEYSEIRRMADQLGDNDEILNSVKKSGNPSLEVLKHVSNIVSNAPKNVSDAFGKVIYYGDAIPKTLMFELFRNTAAYDMARTTFYGLSEGQKAQANRIAERKVKSTTVTDSRAIKGADVLQRKVGIFGSFPRFTAEAIRTFINCHYIMANPGFLYEGETFSSNKDQDKKIKARMNRKNRFVAMAGLSFYYGAFDIIRSLMGLGDDDDDLQKVDIPSNGILEALQLIYKKDGTITQSEALRRILPEYDKFAELQFKVNEDGTVSYRNESTADPFGIWGQAYRSIIYSDGPTSAATNLVKNVATPALGLEVAFGTALEIFNGENSKGEPIYAPDDLTSKQFEDIAAYFARKTGPNIYSSGMRYRDLVRMGKREPGEGVVSNALDYANYTFGEGTLGRESIIDVKKKLQSQVSKIKQDWTTDARLYSGEFYRTIDPKDREVINEQRDEAARRNAYKLHKLVLAAYALNLSEAEVKDVFKKSAISKKVRKAALRGGEYLDKLDVKDIEEKD